MQFVEGVSCRTAGFESMYIDCKKTLPPIPDRLSDVLPPSIEKLHALGKESSQLNLEKGGSLTRQCESPPTFLLVSALSGWFLMRGLSCWTLM